MAAVMGLVAVSMGTTEEGGVRGGGTEEAAIEDEVDDLDEDVERREALDRLGVVELCGALWRRCYR